MMSGIIRLAAALDKARRNKYLQELPIFSSCRFSSDDTNQVKLEKVRGTLSIIEINLRKIKNVTEVLEERNEKRISYIQGLQGKDEKIELDCYQSYSEDEGSFLNAIQRERETLYALENYKLDFQLKREQLEREQDSDLPRSSLLFGASAGVTLGARTQTTAYTTSYPTNNLQLPKFQLKECKGDVLQRNEFWDGFTTSVDNQPIPDIQKVNLFIKLS